jgi:tetratricopeptide (TPR) repeat protein
MTKAAKLTLCLSLLATTALPLQAQTTTTEESVQMAEAEAIRRQEATLQMQMKLNEALAAQKKGQISEAARLYQDAISLFPRVQIGNDRVESEKRMAVAGSTTTRMQLSQEAVKRGAYIEAEEQLTIALKYDPKNEVLLTQKAILTKAATERQGQVPSPEMLKTLPAIQKEKLDAATTVQNAKFLYEMGKYDEAEDRLNDVIKQDPGNKAAFYYLNLIKEARYVNESRSREALAKTRIADVTGKWILENKNESLPVPSDGADQFDLYE